MKTLVVVLSLSLTILSFGGAHAATIFFNNNCPDTVWPATLTADGKPQLSTTGFELASKASSQLDTPAPWTGRVWARTGCSNASGKFVCVTADCASGQVACNGNGGSTPATLAEFTIAPGGGKDYYDVSLVDGFNLRMSVDPQDSTGTCKTSSCPADVNAVCPSELQKQGPDGKVVACFSACAKFGEPQYCCPPPLIKETCPPTKYSKIFHDQCPDAYSYAYDDNNGLFTCSGGPNYVITFCP